ncbi:peptide-methionine (S)-S-oxide reductase MsrA [Paenibacillus sp. LHD-38]|uniref:peptide-methionine (S)-S-oxide reductase MsrA n=1 Tax=Paenibacillus sp. LHD-38 TaxID=3072143 RepID=UPI00280EB129|nr:peptide-methionine (S)-S-oxide reductase MsrA [Paenibacillus sp. LHD-38]MDQ8735013.1 peptide-methionine (S)-S-oxide reductase MsrA [Paenibacillus sp. LHD-38]
MDLQVNQVTSIEPSYSEGELQLAAFGMGCFWGPEALFGHLPGVIKTCVGYAGGTAPNPTYRQMGDHTETVQLVFNPGRITFEEVLDMFWNSHNPFNINDYKGQQYKSLLFYSDERQKDTIQHVLKKRKEQGKGEPSTEIVPSAPFTLAEDKHQKYYLKRFPDAIEKLSILYQTEADLRNSTLAARLNGLAKGYTNLERISQEVSQWPIEQNNKQFLIDLIKKIRW